MRPRALAMVAVFCLAGVMSQFLRSSHAAIAPEVMHALSLSSEALGLVTSAFFLAYALTQVPVGVLLDHLGPRWVVPGGMMLAVLGAVGFGLAASIEGAYLSRWLMGMGSAPIFMGSFVACARWFRPERFGTIAGLISGVGFAGSIVAGTPMALASEWIGWRAAFFAIGGVTAAIAVALLIVVRDAPPGHPDLARAREGLGRVLAGVLRILGNRQMHRLLAMALVGYATHATVFSLWAGPYLNDVHGLSGVERGHVILAMGIVTVIGCFAYGALDRVFDTRKGLVMGGALSTAAMLAVMAAWPSPGVATAAVLLVLFALAASFPVAVTVHGRALFPEHMAGRAMTTCNLGLMLGAATVQSLSGVVVGAFPVVEGRAPEDAYRAVFAGLALITLLAAFVYRRIRDVKPGEPAPLAAGE
ncbi:MAG: MFS transporter [Proteobacteria bacterium]|nr:MFS transporter [Pseudomonadota bacterium]